MAGLEFDGGSMGGDAGKVVQLRPNWCADECEVLRYEKEILTNLEQWVEKYKQALRTLGDNKPHAEELLLARDKRQPPMDRVEKEALAALGGLGQVLRIGGEELLDIIVSGLWDNVADTELAVMQQEDRINHILEVCGGLGIQGAALVLNAGGNERQIQVCPHTMGCNDPECREVERKSGLVVKPAE